MACRATGCLRRATRLRATRSGRGMPEPTDLAAPPPQPRQAARGCGTASAPLVANRNHASGPALRTIWRTPWARTGSARC
eukprot:2725089-Alexandrium_andersonii.AAC.1